MRWQGEVPGIGVVRNCRQRAERGGYPFRVMWFTPLVGGRYGAGWERRRGTEPLARIEVTASLIFAGRS